MWRWPFPVSAGCVAISNPDSLSSNEAGVNPGIRSWKKHSSEWARCQKAIGGIYFTKKWRADTLQPGLEFGIFKPRFESGIFKCISWPNGSFFGGDDWRFLKEGVKNYLMAPMSPLNSSPIFQSSHLLSMSKPGVQIHVTENKNRSKIKNVLPHQDYCPRTNNEIRGRTCSETSK